MNKFKKVAMFAVPAVMIAIPFLAMAALPEPTQPLPGNPLTMDEIQALIERIARFLIIVSVVIAVGFIIIGSIIFISAGGNEDRAKTGKKYIINGIIGAAVVFGVGVILQTTASLVTRTFFG